MSVESRWDHDLPYGEDAQEYVERVVWSTLTAGRVRIEDKRKRRMDNKFYVELQQDPGRMGRYVPSGLSTSEADLWAFVIADTGVVVWVPAVRLRAAVFELGWGARRDGSDYEETDGECPTRGRLLDFNQIIAVVLNALDGA